MTVNTPISYRPDIDGLRAFAILGVLIYHFFPEALPGGFLGVDVFFVISGYLISKILIKSLHSNTFSITTFYGKRIRRIFPALIITGAIFAIYGFFVLLPAEFESLTRHLSNGAIFIANHALYREGGYFDASITHKPFMHLWSLSVEEQFYVLWPFILWIFHKTDKLKWLLSFTLFAIAISYGSDVFYIKRNPDMAFYWLHTRFWEIAVGALMAHLEMNHKKRFSIPFGSTIGLLLIVSSFFFLSQETDHFVYWSLLPIIGAALIVHSTGSKLLSLKPFVWIGLISYPLYLLHWPLVSFPSIIDPKGLTISVKLVLIGISILGSFLIYRFVETPIRKSKSKKTAPRLFISMMVLGLLCFAGARELYSPWSVYTVDGVIQTKTAPKDWGFEMDYFTYHGSMFRKLGEGEPEILFFGDSHMQEYMPRMCLLSKEIGIPIMGAVYGGYCPIPGIAQVLRGGEVEEGNWKFVQNAIKYVKDSKIKTIVISASWSGYFLPGGKGYLHETEQGLEFIGFEKGFNSAMQAFETMLRDFCRLGKDVYIILPTPYGHNPESYFERNFFGIAKRLTTKHIPRAQWDTYSKRMRETLTNVANKVGAKVLDPTPTFCDAQFCKNTTNDGDFIYRDAIHLCASYVKDNVHFLDFLFDQ